MSISNSMAWEVREAGSDLNSGGFRTGASGTDYSQQDEPLIAFTDLFIDGNYSNRVSSRQVGFTPSHIGNTIRVEDGVMGFNPGVYEILDVSNGTATLDKDCGDPNHLGGVGRLGGALADPRTAVTSMSEDNWVWIKAGEYTLTGTQGLSFNKPGSRIFGYHETRGDVTLKTPDKPRPLIRVQAGYSVVLDSPSGTEHGSIAAFLDFEPVIFYLHGLIINGRGGMLYGCRVYGPFTPESPAGIGVSSYSSVYACEVTGDCRVGISGLDGSSITNCYIHDGPMQNGIVAGPVSVVQGNIIAGLTGSEAAIQVNPGGLTPPLSITNNTIYDCDGDGISILGPLARTLIRGNILARCSGYGIALDSPASSPTWSGNAFFSNTSGARHNLDDPSGLDVILTADPFVDAANSDFRLNTNPDGGLLCRGTSPGNHWPGLSFMGRGDMGAVQSEGEGEGGGGEGPIVNKSYLWLGG